MAIQTRSRGTPVIVTAGGAQSLERVKLGGRLHDEAWLQLLIFEHPELLPIAAIEPGFGVPVPVAREIPTAHGFIDDLYVTPTGEIVLVETKLWRNAEARRKVVAQALDYVAALTRLSVEELEKAARQGSGFAAPSLYQLVAASPEALSEPDFIDALGANLRRGRMIVIALGDGIRAECEALGQLLQSHAGAHFTFALVELAIWRDPETGALSCIPDTLAQTLMIERGIVTIENGVPVIKPVPVSQMVTTKARSLTETMFYEELAKVDPQLPAALQAFLASVEPLGIYAELKASLNLKVDLPDMPKPVNFGYIGRNGRLRTNPLGWSVPEAIAVQYNSWLADMIGGTVATHDGIYVSTNGSSAPLVGQFLPAHAAQWREAMRRVLVELAELQRQAA